MPNRDGTGPTGNGPIAGGRRQVPGSGRGNRGNTAGRGIGGSAKCYCPDCGNEIPHRRGTPCSEVKCPKCGSFMRGENCK